jgi:hypothetical protein
MLRSESMAFALPFALVLVAVGQDEPTVGRHDTPAARLAFMKASLKHHAVHPVDDQSAELKLQSEPVMRFNNPVGDVQDGAIFLWTNADDRPEVAVQIFLHNKNGGWFQEFSSLSTAPLAAGEVWRTRERGIKFQAIPDAPRPAETAQLRLRQIRDLTAEFSAEQYYNKTWENLRILTKPFARYGKRGTPIIDGVLLACVLTTDPEIYLLIEAREARDGPEWQYAFAPASIAPIRGFINKKEVWKLPYREAWTDSTAPYYVWGFSAEP